MCSSIAAFLQRHGSSVADVPVVIGGDFNSLWQKHRSDPWDEVCAGTSICAVGLGCCFLIDKPEQNVHFKHVLPGSLVAVQQRATQLLQTARLCVSVSSGHSYALQLLAYLLSAVLVHTSVNCRMLSVLLFVFTMLFSLSSTRYPLAKFFSLVFTRLCSKGSCHPATRIIHGTEAVRLAAALAGARGGTCSSSSSWVWDRLWQLMHQNCGEVLLALPCHAHRQALHRLRMILLLVVAAVLLGVAAALLWSICSPQQACSWTAAIIWRMAGMWLALYSVAGGILANNEKKCKWLQAAVFQQSRVSQRTAHTGCVCTLASAAS